MVVSCSSSENKKTVLSKDQMVEVLIDIHLAEAGVQDIRLKNDSSILVYRTQEKLLYKKHNISDSTFIKSYNYYIEHPDQLEEIYSAVIDSLSLKQVLLRESAGE